MELMVTATVTGEELIEQMYYEDSNELIAWILELDLRCGDTDFTEKLIRGLVESLKREGIKAKFKIKEDE